MFWVMHGHRNNKAFYLRKTKALLGKYTNVFQSSGACGGGQILPEDTHSTIAPQISYIFSQPWLATIFPFISLMSALFGFW